MLDVSRKSPTARTAVASARITMSSATLQRTLSGDTPKGNPLEVAKVAAIQAAKHTSTMIPYCHPLPVDYVGVEWLHDDTSLTARVTVKAVYKTGVEMEALTAASVAALTVYDMLKMLDESLIITEIRLLEKHGGKSDFREEILKPLRAGVLVMSDSISSGKKSDRSGRIIVERLEQERMEVVKYEIIPDDTDTIARLVKSWSDDLHLDLVVTTGGTGFSPRDCTPEAMQQVFEREIPGIPEAMRAYGQERTPYSMLSRSTAGIRGETIILNLPGSTKGVAESLDAIFPAILHGFKMLWAGDHPQRERNSRGSK